MNRGQALKYNFSHTSTTSKTECQVYWGLQRKSVGLCAVSWQRAGGLLSRAMRSALETWTTEGPSSPFCLEDSSCPDQSHDPCEVAPQGDGEKERSIAQNLQGSA